RLVSSLQSAHDTPLASGPPLRRRLHKRVKSGGRPRAPERAGRKWTARASHHRLPGERGGRGRFSLAGASRVPWLPARGRHPCSASSSWSASASSDYPKVRASPSASMLSAFLEHFCFHPNTSAPLFPVKNLQCCLGD
uniref:Uncharacterized protein n=1 Tax=Aegilops tauschii subsp. strangulata TaxID=200361 RepID=A0A453KPL2_AEGTS